MSTFNTFKKFGLAAILLALVLAASPAFAFFPCEGVCNCSVDCYVNCFANGGAGPLVTCGNGGYLCDSRLECDGGLLLRASAAGSANDLTSFLASLQAGGPVPVQSE